MRRGLNSAHGFVQVNHLLLSKSYEKTSGKLALGQGETTWGETHLGQNNHNSTQHSQ